jgi:hypothetical protein
LFYAQEPTREVSGPILRGVEEQVHKRNLIALLRPLPPITKLIKNQETTVRYIICASGAIKGNLGLEKVHAFCCRHI